MQITSSKSHIRFITLSTLLTTLSIPTYLTVIALPTIQTDLTGTDPTDIITGILAITWGSASYTEIVIWAICKTIILKCMSGMRFLISSMISQGDWYSVTRILQNAELIDSYSNLSKGGVCIHFIASYIQHSRYASCAIFLNITYCDTKTRTPWFRTSD